MNQPERIRVAAVELLPGGTFAAFDANGRQIEVPVPDAIELWAAAATAAGYWVQGCQTRTATMTGQLTYTAQHWTIRGANNADD